MDWLVISTWLRWITEGVRLIPSRTNTGSRQTSQHSPVRDRLESDFVLCDCNCRTLFTLIHPLQDKPILDTRFPRTL